VSSLALQVGELYARLKLDKQQYDKALSDAERATKRLADTQRQAARDTDRLEREFRDLERQTRRVDDEMQRLASTLSSRLAAAIAALKIADVTRDAINAGIALNNLAQTAEIGFETMLGSAERAQAFIRDLRQFAAETPFEFEGLITSAQMMLAFGAAAEDVLPRLRAIGDAAAAIGAGKEGIDRVTRALGQMQAKGVVAAEEMLQLAEAGIPAWDILAEKIGVDIPTAMELVSRRAVSADQAIAMLVAGIDERFGGMMERQARTVEGLRARIVDEFTQAAAQGVEPLFQSLQRNMQWVVDNMPFFAEAIRIALGSISEVIARVLDGIRAMVEEIQDAILSMEPLARRILSSEYLRRLAEVQEKLPSAYGFAPALVRSAEIITQLSDAIREARTQAETEADRAGRAVGSAFAGAFELEIEPTVSAAFERWQSDIDAIKKQLELATESLIVYRNNLIDAADKADLVRLVEYERVLALEAQLEAQQKIIEATRRALASGELLADEAARLEYELDRAERAAARLRGELSLARDELRLAEYREPLELLEYRLQNIGLRFDLSADSVEVLAERLEEVIAEIEKLNDGTNTYLSLLLEARRLLDRLREAMPAAPVPVTPDQAIPEVMPREERISRQFDRLRLLVEAELVPVEEAVSRLAELRAELVSMAAATGGLAGASDEVIRLFIELTAVMEDWIESLQQAPSRLEEIRAAMERALGVGMAVEREIARATGVGFDPIAYEMAVLERAIREMYEATGEITAEMERLLYQLAALSREAEALALTQAVVTSALDAFGRNLGDIGRLLSRSIRFEAGRGLAGFSLDPTAFLTGAISAGIDMLFRAIGGMDSSSAALERAAQALQQASESWRRTLSEAQFHELISATPAEAISELQRVRGEVWAEMRRIERWGIWPWERGTYDALKQQLREIDREIATLQQGWTADLEQRVEELLGITTRGLQGAVSGAFSASTAEDFAANIESALVGRVRNAFVTAFLESATMAPLFEQLGDMIREALVDIRISPDEMEGIREIMDEIKQRSQPFYELLDEMGLLADVTERVNREFERLVNVPLGRRVLQALRFQSMTPAVVPTFHGGGVMPYDGLANLRRGEIILTPEQARALGGGDSGMVFTGPITVVANDPVEFERKLRDYMRRESLRRTGNPTALERVRR